MVNMEILNAVSHHEQKDQRQPTFVRRDKDLLNFRTIMADNRTSVAETSSIASGIMDPRSLEINKEDFVIKSLYKLSEDLIKFLSKPEGYDVKLKIGKEPEVEEFYAHSAILRARSSYFYKALSKDSEGKAAGDDGNASTVSYIYTAISNFMSATEEDNVITFTKENIHPKAFKFLLNIIYGGVAKADGLTPIEFLDLLEAYDELGIRGYDEYLQQYFLENHGEWVRENLLALEDFTSKHKAFHNVRSYCLDQLCQNSELVFKASDVKPINKNVIVALLNRDDLIAEEIDLWNFVVQWGIAQVPGVSKEGAIDWTKEEEVGKLKETLHDVIPLIRFKWIGHEDFYEKVRPHKPLFDQTLYEKTMKHYFTAVKPKPTPTVQTTSLPPLESASETATPATPASPASSVSSFLSPRARENHANFIINENESYASLISCWIGNKPFDASYQQHKFKLLYRGSRNKFSTKVFHDKCDSTVGTLTIARIKGTGELVGGYNNRCWNPKKVSGRATSSTYPIYSAKAFIFKINKDDLEKSIISRISEHYNALCYKKDSGPNFFDLIIFDQTTPISYEKKSYDTDLELEGRELEEYEVYRVL